MLNKANIPIGFVGVKQRLKSLRFIQLLYRSLFIFLSVTVGSPIRISIPDREKKGFFILQNF